MKRHLAAGLSILAVVAGVGWKLASHPDTSAELQSSVSSSIPSTRALGRRTHSQEFGFA
jgi:hypothetical protein